MFSNWTGNRFYVIKTLGSPTECLDKFIFGVLISSVLLFLLMGPFYLFSTMSPLVDFNPVTQGSFHINLQVNKTIGFDAKRGQTKKNLEEGDDSYGKINSSVPYGLFALKNPYLQEFDAGMW